MRKFSKIPSTLAAGCAILAMACSTSATATIIVANERSDAPVAGTPATETSEIRIRTEIVQSAQALLGNRPNARISVNGKNFVLDCVGTVKAAYWGAGISLDGDPGKFGGNGVAVLWYNAEAFGEILKDATLAAPGDLVFWDNTWDRNGNGVFGDDPLTHVGIITAVGEDGTVEYLHLDYVKGVVLEVMTVDRPNTYYDEDGRKINSAMYMASYPGSPKNPPLWTAGDLFRGYGDAEALEERWPQ